MHVRRSLTVLGLVLGALLATGSTARAPAPVVLSAAATGQTGCLHGGTYTQRVVRFGRGGRAGAAIRLTSFPGERARLVGVVYVPHGSDHVTVSDLDIDGSAGNQVTVQVMAAD